MFAILLILFNYALEFPKVEEFMCRTSIPFFSLLPHNIYMHYYDLSGLWNTMLYIIMPFQLLFCIVYGYTLKREDVQIYKEYTKYTYHTFIYLVYLYMYSVF